MSVLLVIAWLAMIPTALVGLALLRRRLAAASSEWDGINEFERWQHTVRRAPVLADQAGAPTHPAIPAAGAHRSRRWARQ